MCFAHADGDFPVAGKMPTGIFYSYLLHEVATGCDVPREFLRYVGDCRPPAGASMVPVGPPRTFRGHGPADAPIRPTGDPRGDSVTSSIYHPDGTVTRRRVLDDGTIEETNEPRSRGVLTSAIVPAVGDDAAGEAVVMPMRTTPEDAVEDGTEPIAEEVVMPMRTTPEDAVEDGTEPIPEEVM